VVFDKIIDARHWVPQHRERIFIVCFDTHVFGKAPKFRFDPLPDGPQIRFKDILLPKPDSKYTLSDHLWKYLQDYAERHRKKGNGFGYGLTDLDGVSRTLSARYYKDGSEVLIPSSNGGNPRRLTPLEAARLMGFPDKFKPVVSDTQAYKQFGNAVVPDVVQFVGSRVLETVNYHFAKTRKGCILKLHRRIGTKPVSQ